MSEDENEQKEISFEDITMRDVQAAIRIIEEFLRVARRAEVLLRRIEALTRRHGRSERLEDMIAQMIIPAMLPREVKGIAQNAIESAEMKSESTSDEDVQNLIKKIRNGKLKRI